MTRVDWRAAAIKQKLRAENWEQRTADLNHALNLLANDSVDWFASYRTSDGNTHRFGIGVAANIRIKDPMRAVITGRKTEHRVIIFWLTEWAPEEGGDVGKHLSAHPIDDFKQLPGQIKEDKSDPETRRSLATILEKAVQGIDEAQKNYSSKSD